MLFNSIPSGKGTKKKMDCFYNLWICLHCLLLSSYYTQKCIAKWAIWQLIMYQLMHVNVISLYFGEGPKIAKVSYVWHIKMEVWWQENSLEKYWGVFLQNPNWKIIYVHENDKGYVVP